MMLFPLELVLIVETVELAGLQTENEKKILWFSEHFN